MGMYGGPDDNHAVIPLSTFRALFGQETLSNFVFRADRPAETEAVKKRVYEVLGGKYRFDPSDERALSIWDTLEGMRVMNNITLGIELFLGFIGALTLLIGGVGVANIMYAVVKHRTKEIGVQMALGAKRSYVLGPLVLESLALTAIGGADRRGGGRRAPSSSWASCSASPTARRSSSWAPRPSPGRSRSPRSSSSERSASWPATSPPGGRSQVQPAVALRYE